MVVIVTDDVRAAALLQTLVDNPAPFATAPAAFGLDRLELRWVDIFKANQPKYIVGRYKDYFYEGKANYDIFTLVTWQC